MPGVQKRYSDFERDLNGDGFIDIALADCSSNQDFFGDVRVYFGSADGISITPGWTYTCTISNFMETK